MEQFRIKLVDDLLDTLSNVFLLMVALWVFIWWLIETGKDEQVNKD